MKTDLNGSLRRTKQISKTQENHKMYSLKNLCSFVSCYQWRQGNTLDSKGKSTKIHKFRILGGVLYCGLYRDLKADIFGDSTLSEVSF